MEYLDRCFCPSTIEDGECANCYRKFHKDKYDESCKKDGFQMPIAWLLTAPCGRELKDSENILKNKEKDKDNG